MWFFNLDSLGVGPIRCATVPRVGADTKVPRKWGMAAAHPPKGKAHGLVPGPDEELFAGDLHREGGEGALHSTPVQWEWAVANIHPGNPPAVDRLREECRRADHHRGDGDSGSDVGRSVHRSIVCNRTTDYQLVVRSVVIPGDTVLEIGSAYGDCLAAVHSMMAHHYPDAAKITLVGLDISTEATAEASRRHPHIRFASVDALTHPHTILDAARITAVDVVAVDINGTRSLADVATLIASVQTILLPRVIVVKSEEMFAMATKHLRTCAHDVCPDSNTISVLPQNEVWCSAVAAQIRTAKRCERCDKTLFYKSKFSIVWPTVKFCQDDCLVDAIKDGHPMAREDSGQVLLSNKLASRYAL